MDLIGAYLLRLTCAALACGIVRALPASQSAGHLLKMLTGIFMLLVILSPITGAAMPSIQWDLATVRRQAYEIVESANCDTQKQLSAIIISETEAYILDKAKSFGAELTVEVSVDNSALPQPDAVTLRGAVSPYARARLCQLISQELGIPEEDQTWTD